MSTAETAAAEGAKSGLATTAETAKTAKKAAAEGAKSGPNPEKNKRFFKKIGFKDFSMSSLTGAEDYLSNVTIDNTDIEHFFTDEGNKESLIYILKNDSVFKEVFKDDNREAEAIEDIKKKIEEYKSSDDVYISDLFDFLNDIKKFIIEKNKETKGIDDFINNFSDKLDKLLEEKIKNEPLNTDQEGNAKKIFRL